MMWIVWLSGGIVYAAAHRGMPFGAVASVVAWHRIGARLSRVVLQSAKAPVARYVDAFFGASKAGVKWFSEDLR